MQMHLAGRIPARTQGEAASGDRLARLPGSAPLSKQIGKLGFIGHAQFRVYRLEIVPYGYRGDLKYPRNLLIAASPAKRVSDLHLTGSQLIQRNQATCLQEIEIPVCAKLNDDLRAPKRSGMAG